MTALLADPGLTRRTAGEELARVVVGDPDPAVTVELATSLPTTFPLAKHRPRYTVRHLCKTATVTGEKTAYVCEAAGDGAPERSGVTYASSPEANVQPELRTAELSEVAVRVTVPAGLAADPTLLAAYVDHRVLVRLCTVENQVLLWGSADGVVPGLLHLSGSRRRLVPGSLADELTAAAAEVEETGGSCDGLVAHPETYWQLVQSGLLSRLSEIGVRVGRTRMIPRHQVLLGDYRAAVTLLETGTSQLTFCRGAGAGGADIVRAGLRIALAVHLPQHFLLLERT